MTPAPTPSGYSNESSTSGNMGDSASAGRNNPAAAAREGSSTDTAGKNVGGIRNMGTDPSSSTTIDSGRANSGSGSR